jgi:DNA-binding XRE family transcriptional regulator
MNTGMKIKILRIQKGWNQKELANRVGVSQVAISQYEKEAMRPTDTIKVKIAAVLDAGVEELFFES